MCRWKNDCGSTSNKSFFFSTLLPLVVISAIIATLDRCTSVNPEIPIQAIQVQGWSQPKIFNSNTHHGCGIFEYSFKIKANNPAGKVVKIIVCCERFSEICAIKSGSFEKAETSAKLLKSTKVDNPNSISTESNPLSPKSLDIKHPALQIEDNPPNSDK